MQLILAIDSDPRRSEQLATLVHARLQVEFVQATSAGEGLHALRDRVPDLILTSPLLSPFDDGVLDEYLRDLGSAATHVQTLRIPMLSSGPKKKSAATRLFSLGRKKAQTSPASPDGCDPKVFADEIAHYLTRSLEERAASVKGTRGQAAPVGMPTAEPEPFEQLVEEWAAPDAVVQEFNETLPTDWSAEARGKAAPEPVIEDSHMPGSIFDLRTPSPRAAQRVVVAAPEPYAFIEPDPVVEPEPVVHEFVETERFVEPAPFESSPVDFVNDEPLTVAHEEPVQHEPVLIKPQAFDSQVRPAVRVEPVPPVTEPPVLAPPVMALPVAAPPVKAPPPAPVAQTPAPATGSSSSGNSASFEAALAAIRAAWAKPESASTPPPAAASASPVAATSRVGSGEVDLSNQIDPLEEVTATDALEDSNTSKARRKTDKAGKRPEKPKARRTTGAEGDWGVFDPNQYELSALVTKLDEVTDSDEVGAHGRTTRATNRR